MFQVLKHLALLVSELIRFVKASVINISELLFIVPGIQFD